MRRFEAAYLADTRRGLWEDRSALAALDLPGRDRILDVGCGTGEFTRVLRDGSAATVLGLDADPSLLRAVEADGLLLGDATRLPLAADSVDLVTCQALLVNLPDPAVAVREFARVSSDRVALIEPDNAGVAVDSTVDAEARLADRARAAYIDGVSTDVTIGAAAGDFLRDAGLVDVTTRRHDHVRRVDPPYTDHALEGARRKVAGERLDDARPVLADAMTDEAFDDLRSRWRSMGRAVVDQMRAGEYERTETVPFYVSVGRVRSD